LADSSATANRLDHGQRFVDGQGRGLFDKDVLARLSRQHRGRSMPAFARGNHHGIDVLAGQQFAEIVAGSAGPIRTRGSLRGIGCLDSRLGVLPTPAIHVADSQHLGLRILDEPRQVVPLAHEPDADEPQGDAIARGHMPITP